MTEEERFWGYVDADGDCWVWTGALNFGGYGQFSVGGKNAPAHRYAYELLVGPIPDGLVLDHLCRNPPCVNPDHLEPVTERVNILRGFGVTAMAAKKTHCPQGHPYSGYNLIPQAKGRACRACKNNRRRTSERSRANKLAYERKRRAERKASSEVRT